MHRKLLPNRNITLWVVWLGLACLAESRLPAAGFDDWRLGIPTLGGPAHWTDHVVQGDWRIQRHVLRGHFRLLDPCNISLAHGSFAECGRELQHRVRCGEVPRLPRHVVILLHGLCGTRALMRDLQYHLECCGGYTVLNFGYASTQGTIQEQASALDDVLRNLHGVEEVSFVGHSMGNIVVRNLLHRYAMQGNPHGIIFRRMVMVSPPNQGARLASTLGQGPIIQLVGGEVVDQFALDKGWPCLSRELATPEFEFGIIAGGRFNDHGYLPGIPGDDDGLLSIRTHYLDGASDFVQLGGLHQIMPKYRDVQHATLCFLKQGRF